MTTKAEAVRDFARVLIEHRGELARPPEPKRPA